MKEWKIEVVKYTDVDSLHMANSFTTGHESKMSLAKAYAYKHSPVRTQRFYIKMYDIPLFCASQFVRSTQGVQWYQKSKRTDRGGEDFGIECYDFGQRLDIIAEQIGEGLSEDEVKDITDVLNDMEKEVKSLPSRFDRYAPTDLLADCNAEFIINMSMKRLCSKASRETREIWGQVIAEVAKVDSDLAKFCVKPCIMCSGICREPKSCGFNKTELFNKQLTEYKKLFL